MSAYRQDAKKGWGAKLPGWRAKIDLEEGLRRTIDWWRASDAARHECHGSGLTITRPPPTNAALQSHPVFQLVLYTRRLYNSG
jgi:hypothetical protein